MQPEFMSSETSQDHKDKHIYTKVGDWPTREVNKKGSVNRKKKGHGCEYDQSTGHI